jgi:hypothetical protein
MSERWTRDEGPALATGQQVAVCGHSQDSVAAQRPHANEKEPAPGRDSANRKQGDANEAERFQSRQREVETAAASKLGPMREKAIHRMNMDVQRMFPGAMRSAESRDSLRDLMVRSYARADQVSTEEDALMWAEGFRMPVELAEETSENLADANGDFDRMVRNMRDEIDGDRISAASISAALSADNPEIPALKELAEGMVTLVSEDYKPTPRDDLPGMRGGMKRVGTAVEKLIHENFIDKGLAFVMRVENMPEGTLVHPAGWAPKAGKAKGRNTGDLGDMGGGTPLNSIELRDKYEERWGAINNPTVDNFDDMFSTILTDHVPPGHVLSDNGDDPDDPVSVVIDLKAAYNLVSYRSDQVRLIATLISAGLIVFFLCGIFGWTGTPFAFNVVTRAIVYELERLVKGLSLMYVDDIATCCLRRNLKFNMALITTICTTLLGRLAIEEKKTVVADGAGGRGWVNTIIGYDWCLKRRQITISTKNIERAFHAFLDVDVDGDVTRETMERLASLASRYAAVVRSLSPFISPLYASYTWMTSRNPLALVKLGPKAKQAIRMIKILLVLAHIDPEHFSRPFKCDIARLIKFVIEFDASLTGIGLIIFRIDEATGAETPVGVAGVSIEELGFRGASSNQNLAEFIAGALGTRAVIACGGRECAIAVRGDSVSALSWIDRERFSGQLVNHAAIAYVLQAIAWGIKVEQVTHLPAEQNTAADYLSRLGEKGRTIEDFRSKFPRFKDVPVVDPKPANFIPLCDPKIDIDSDERFVAFWLRAQAVIGGRTLGGGNLTKRFPLA